MKSNQAGWRKKYGSWALVTGASDGIGREMAISLAQRGLHLILVARRQAVLETLAQELKAQYGISTVVIAADLSQSAGVDLVIEKSKTYDIGLLVASAGFGTSGEFIDAPLSLELNLLDVNCRAVLALTHEFGQRFALQKRGGIVLMSSLLAFQGVPRSANYAASKAYIQSLAEGLHAELAPHGVDVIASAPGPTESGFAGRANMQMSLAAKPTTVAEETLKALGRKSVVRPGLMTQLITTSLMLLPRWGRVRAMGLIMQSMTHHQT